VRLLLHGPRRWTRLEVAERAGMAPERTQRLWRALGFPDAAAKRKRHVSASTTKCCPVGAPCEGKQAERCCAGLVCLASDRGSVRRWLIEHRW